MDTRQLTFEAIGTQWVIDYIGDKVSKKNTLLQEIMREINAFDVLYSRFREDSLISHIATTPGKYPISADGVQLLTLYKQLYDLTNGAFTPLIGNMLADAGYDASYSFQPKKLQKPPRWEDVITLDNSTLIIKNPAILDFGGLGKGYMIDVIASLLEKHGIQNFCIDAGGDILYKNHKDVGIDIGLEHPQNFNQVIGVAHIVNQSICASAGNRRKWSQYHHIMNPHTLSAQNTVLATWVVADTTLVADAIATCLFFTAPEVLREQFSFEYVIVYPDHTVAKSSNIPVEFY
ncbi:MAG TPA: FAD:protein FMN transferase [Candidatus Levybacteria bacterium]|nr:FAD:protein FMN transferase [Candidatus Levybacteria bacterium]